MDRETCKKCGRELATVEDVRRLPVPDGLCWTGYMIRDPQAAEDCAKHAKTGGEPASELAAAEPSGTCQGKAAVKATKAPLPVTRDPLHAGKYDDEGCSIYLWAGDHVIATVHADENLTEGHQEDCEQRAAFIVAACNAASPPPVSPDPNRGRVARQTYADWIFRDISREPMPWEELQDNEKAAWGSVHDAVIAAHTKRKEQP